MLKVLFKIVPAVIFWGIVIFIVLKLPYPESLVQANIAHLALFFISLYLALVFSVNIFLKNIFLSSSVSSGIIFLLILKALNLLNFVSGTLIIISVGLLFSYFRKMKKRSLTKLPKIPKLISLHRKEK